jgi:putative acetyltransferase
MATLDIASVFNDDRFMKIEPAVPSYFERLVAIWESSVRATHHFLQDSDIAALRPLLLNAYLPNLNVVIARDERGDIHGFLGVDENRIEMLFVDAASRGKGVGSLLLRYAIDHFGANEVDVNEQNPQGIEFYQHRGFVQIGRSELDGQGNPFPLLHMRYGG